MINKAILVTLFLLLSYELTAQSVFFEKYPDAKNFALLQFESMQILKKHKGDEAKIIYAIVAPEVAMYNDFLDFFETRTSEIFYTNLGSDYANFSLGLFQMKPSFAEEIENCYINECTECSFKSNLLYTHLTNESEIRLERINRLKNNDWQQIYLLCFYEILEARHSNQFNLLQDKIAFYAAAYNFGFNQPKHKINKWKKVIAFPGRTQESIAAYSDVAVDFLTELAPQKKLTLINKTNLLETNCSTIILSNQNDKLNINYNSKISYSNFITQNSTPQKRSPLSTLIFSVCPTLQFIMWFFL